MKYWNYTLIPDRVESRSQKEKLDRIIEEEREAALEKLKNSENKNNEVIERQVINIDHQNNIVRENNANNENERLNNERNINDGDADKKQVRFANLKRRINENK